MSFYKDPNEDPIFYALGDTPTGFVEATDAQLITFCFQNTSFYYAVIDNLDEVLTATQISDLASLIANPPQGGASETDRVSFTFETVDCLITKNDHEGVTGVLFSFQMDWISEAQVKFKNGNSLIITAFNFESFGQAWADARAVFFV